MRQGKDFDLQPTRSCGHISNLKINEGHHDLLLALPCSLRGLVQLLGRAGLAAFSIAAVTMHR